MIDRRQLAAVLVEHLPGQRWFAQGERPFTAADVEVVTVDGLRGEWPGLVRVLVSVAGVRWQLVLGLRPPDSREAFFEGKPEALLGTLDTELGPALAYDATIDPELAVILLGVIAPGEEVARARPLMAEQSNTSVVYDERLILKLFRRLVEGPNPDAEVSRALAGVGFANVAELVAEWRVDGDDCAIVNAFLTSGSDGFSLALTSLRDLYDLRGDPREAGGDFGPDARRLGIITAKMHLALAEA
ncbi:MAG: hypothetical protein H0U26_07580, partial [Acidimicrobiia bacterium]|nr:hypothetical protein [Acidimicrobiia bacterium]